MRPIGVGLAPLHVILRDIMLNACYLYGKIAPNYWASRVCLNGDLDDPVATPVQFTGSTLQYFCANPWIFRKDYLPSSECRDLNIVSRGTDGHCLRDRRYHRERRSGTIVLGNV